MKNKKTLSKYSNRVILKILRYNDKQVKTAEFNSNLRVVSNELMDNLMYSGSFLNQISRMVGSFNSEFIYDELYPTEPQNLFKLSRKR